MYIVYIALPLLTLFAMYVWWLAKEILQFIDECDNHSMDS